jgi:signal transduction histidine kinase
MKYNIRTRLTIQFTLIVALILAVFSIGIYLFSANYRKAEFYARLENKAFNTANLLIEVKEIDYNLLKIIDKNTIQALYHEKVEIFDYTNRQIYNSLDDDTIQISKALLDEIRIKKRVRFQAGKYEAIGLAYKESYKSYVVVASAYDKYGRSKLSYLTGILLSGFFVSIGMSVFMGRIYAGRSLKPMSDIVEQVDKMTIESLHMRVQVGNKKDEIARLAMTFNRMLDRLESAFEMQRSFVSNASHELRNPLTSITGQIEVALMKTRSTVEYKVILESVLEDIRNLNKLSDGLLDLAKASSDSSEVTMQPVRIDEILWETREELFRRKNEFDIAIQFHEPIEDEKDLMVRGNPHLLKSAILNLMENGCKFSFNNKVKIFLKAESGQVTLTFTDEGIVIGKEEMGNIMQPFHRAKNARTFSGSGLGLPLADRIIRLHQGCLSIDSAEGTGTVITVSLPILC